MTTQNKKSYKVELKYIETYCIDVTAKDQKEAEDYAKKIFADSLEAGTYHYNETGEPITEVSGVYDVSNTDDPFNPQNQ